MKRKIFISNCLICLLTLLLSAVLIGFTLYNDFYHTMKKEVANETLIISNAVDLSGEAYLENLRHYDNRITLISPDGAVLFDSQAPVVSLENHLDRPEVSAAIEDGIGESTRLSETLNYQTYYYAVQLRDGQILRVSCTTNTVLASLISILPWFLLAALLIILVAMSVAIFQTRRIVKPINELDLEEPENNQMYDELAPLLGKIHKQNGLIKQQMLELKEKQLEFTAITENMAEGFLVIDPNGEVLSFNTSALGILGVSQSSVAHKNVFFWNRSSAFRNAVTLALHGESAEQILELSGKQYQLLVNPVRMDETIKGAIIIILDITEKQDREQLRREFSANVSHELKTPLTSISGYAEIIKNGLVKPEDIPKFADTIYSEAQRMITLVGDIIQLSRLDESNIGMEQDVTDLYEIASSVIDRLTPFAQKEKITLQLTGCLAPVMGSRQMLDEMIYNLCDNAIKYNQPNGTVIVQTSLLDNEVNIRIKDTGIGIAPNEQERIFERFYRVDKSHSNSIGGTGLGLSIVKHCARLHNAKIRLESAPSKGTCIELVFPSITTKSTTNK